MKRFLPFLIYMMPLCSVAQDLIVTTDSDTLPCRIQFVAGGEVAFVGEGMSDQSKVLLSQVGAYRFGGRWQQVGGSEVFAPQTADAKDDAQVNLRLSAKHFKNGGYLLAVGGGMFLAGGVMQIVYHVGQRTETIYSGTTPIEVVVSPAAELAYVGTGLLIAGGLMTVSAGFEIAAGGIKLARVQGVPVK
jgi:hypothetical protein